MRQARKTAQLLEDVRVAAERVRNGRRRSREQLRAALDAARAGGLSEDTLTMATRDLPAEPQPSTARRRPRLVRMRWGDDG